ncbi:MAG: L,D-transpeptidase [Polyangiaceae bacterium]
MLVLGSLLLAVSCHAAKVSRPPLQDLRAGPDAGADPSSNEDENPSAEELAGTPDPQEGASTRPNQPDNRKRIGSIKWYTRIYDEPHRTPDTMEIGTIRIGTSIPLRSNEPVPGDGCAHKWWAVEPFGYICSDETTTTDFDSAYWKALSSVTPSPGAFPYRYAYSMGAPMYSRVPTPEEVAWVEGFGNYPKKGEFRSLGKWAKGHEELVDKEGKEPIKATDALPEFLADHKPIPGGPFPSPRPKVRELPPGTGFSYAKAFEADGRVWLLTPELFVIPADRVFSYRQSTFHGVELGDKVKLPLVWIKEPEEPKLKRVSEGVFEPSGKTRAKQDHVMLTGQKETVGKRTYRETREGDWIEDTDRVAVVEAVEKIAPGIADNERWLDARIVPGYAVAYEGIKPVWTTLWSAGKGGPPVPGKDPTKYAMTEIGSFLFQWKDKVSTMSPDKGAPTVFWFADVPHIQYVKAPLALHVAYWHNNFGHWMSAECLNFSPLDGEWLFNFTLPKLPEGWNAVRPTKTTGAATRIVIRGL